MSEESTQGILAGECTVHRIRPRGRFSRLMLRMPSGFPEPIPGQFILVSCQPSLDDLLPSPERLHGSHLARFLVEPVGDRTMLPRPLSIFDYARQSKNEPALVTLLFKIVGRGTLGLSMVRPGDRLRFLGPLGNGFETDGWGRTLLVAGGIGLAGINFLARTLSKSSQPPLTILGVDDRGQSPVRLSLTEVPPVYHWALPKTTEPLRLVISRLFDNFMPSIVTSLYPGDQGAFCGTATDLVERLFEANPTYPPETTLVGCGPRPMLEALTTIARHHHVRRFLVLLEERMACGVGTCLGCAVKVREGALPFEGDAAQKGPTTFKRVCTDGPVFNGYRIVWEHEGEVENG
ncbi:MAG: hypothetical protein DRH70_03915 [Candidatus Coatesbacteria bacterium]|nr:MAG: hypothetical protein DRH70_03915 [Candidatus Coatesbacteria bacterium]